MAAAGVCFLLGGLAVLQAGLNRQVMAKWGLSTAILINSSVLIAAAAVFWFTSSASRPEGFRFQWWYLIPGICGFALVAGIPWAIPRIGALRAFLFIVVAQMIASFLWDLYVEGTGLDVRRLIGALVAVVGLMIANWRAHAP